MTLGVSLLNKTTTVKKDCQQLFRLFNINLTKYFQIDRISSQIDDINIKELTFNRVVFENIFNNFSGFLWFFKWKKMRTFDKTKVKRKVFLHK